MISAVVLGVFLVPVFFILVTRLFGIKGGTATDADAIAPTEGRA